MFHFGAYGGFLVFSAFDLSLRAGGAVFACAGPAIDLITDRLPLIVLFKCFRALVRPEITAVSIDHFLFAGQQIGSDSNIMDMGSSYLDRMYQTTLAITPMWAL